MEPRFPSPEEVSITGQQVRQLRAAASKLRQLSPAVTPGRWDADVFTQDGPWEVGRDVDLNHGPSWQTVLTAEPSAQAGANAQWAALLGPQLAEPLAAWLEAAARDAESIGPDFRAVEVARVLLIEERP